MAADRKDGDGSPAVRRYREGDLGALYDICVRTADGGGDARGNYHSDDLMPDLFAGPYVFLEPDFAFVLDDGHQAVGYVVGTPDTAAFARGYRERWIPRLAGRYPVPPVPPVTPDEQMIALHYWPERLLWPGLPEYPAHLHIDLLPDFQGAGHGRRLMAAFCGAVARAGAAGVHVTVVAGNVRAIGFYRRLGFGPLDVEDPGAVAYLGRKLSVTGSLAPAHAPGRRRALPERRRALPERRRTPPSTGAGWRYRHKNRRMPVIPAGQWGAPRIIEWPDTAGWNYAAARFFALRCRRSGRAAGGRAAQAADGSARLRRS